MTEEELKLENEKKILSSLYDTNITLVEEIEKERITSCEQCDDGQHLVCGQTCIHCGRSGIDSEGTFISELKDVCNNTNMGIIQFGRLISSHNKEIEDLKNQNLELKEQLDMALEREDSGKQF